MRMPANRAISPSAICWGRKPRAARFAAPCAVFLGLAITAVSFASRVDAAEANRVGKTIESFSLHDVYGKMRSLDELADAKLVVVAFLGIDCPLVKLYAPRLEQLADEYAGRGVAFIGINSNRQDSPTQMANFARRYGLSFPLLKDPDNAVADQFEALRTPEVFVLDDQRVVRYWGRIDDQYGIGDATGYARPKIHRRDLAEALNELLDGKEVSQPAVEAPGCLIGRMPKVEPHGDITFSKQVIRILNNRCVECHREGQVAPFPLTNYEEVAGWSEMIREVVEQGRMPPWYADPRFGHWANDARLTDEDKQTLITWVKNGSPEGDPRDLPEPPQFADGWKIPQPDAVFHMDKEFVVPAEGVVDYQHYVIDLGLEEDKWVQASEARPGNPAVVHHIVAFVLPPGARPGAGLSGGGGGTLLSVFAPGTPPWTFPEGTAIKLAKGSKLMLQMHYTPNGTAQADRSYIGLKFADPATVKRSAISGAALNFGFKIPPGADDYAVSATTRFRRDTLLLNLFPHMHLRGKAMKWEAEYPDGTREVLLDVPNYDFNWQLRYDFVEPKLMPAGSRIHVTGRFDNSENNPANPDPTKEVTFGEQTWEEMMIGFFTSARVDDDPSEEAGNARDVLELEKSGGE